MKVLAIANHKGGVGKTTLAFHLIKALAKKGHSVLGIDMDPQGNLSVSLYNDRIPDEHHVKLLFDDGKSHPVPMKICDGDGSCVYLLGSSIHLASFDSAGATLLNYFKLKSYLEKRLWQQNDIGEIDYIIIDTPPNLGIFTMSAIVASQYLVIPLDLSIYALDGLRELTKKIRELSEEINHNIKTIGVLLMDSNERTNMAKSFNATLTESFGDTFLGEIPHSIKMKEAFLDNVPVWELAPNNKAANKMKEVVEEIIKRMA